MASEKVKKYKIKEKDNIKHIRDYFLKNKENIKGINLGSYKITGVGRQSLMLKHGNGDSVWVNYIDLVKSIKKPEEATGYIALIIQRFVDGLTINFECETEAEEIFRKIVDKTENYNDLLKIQTLLQDKIEKLQKKGNYREILDLNKLFPRITITNEILKSSGLLKSDDGSLNVNDELIDEKLILNLLEDILKKKYNVNNFKYRGVANLNTLKETIKWQINEITGIFNSEYSDGFFKVDKEIAEIYYLKLRN
ncbi:MAG: hypothetical protein LBB45_06675 [Methanobrevibacter sp.]|jgi:hypothetical protein|nr:hypothetical protein [Candidatus Methanovirga basalitermitum]